MKIIMWMAVITVCFFVAVTVLTYNANANTSTITLEGEVEGAAVPDGNIRLAFSFYDIDSDTIVHRTEATAFVRNARYNATINTKGLKSDKEYYLCIALPNASAEYQEPIGIVMLQSNTPGIQQIGHANINGTFIASSIQTGAFRMSTDAGAGRVLTSDSVGRGTWQNPPPPSGSAGGDLSGGYPNPSVVALQKRAVSSTFPSDGQILKWIGNAWTPATDDNFTLPFSGSANVSSDAVFSITNTASGGANYGGRFENSSTSGVGVYGLVSATSGTNYGGFFRSDSTSGYGVLGWAPATSGTTYGGYFWSNSTSGYGVLGWASATSGTNYGGYFQTSSTTGRGVNGIATATSGTNYGGYFQSSSTTGRGVNGIATATSGTNYGGYFQSSSTTGRGVNGIATATSGLNYGGYFQSNSTHGAGVFGIATDTSGSNFGGIFFSNGANGIGVHGYVDDISGTTRGVNGITNSTVSGAFGVYGAEPGGGSGHAVYAFGTLAATGSKSFQIDHPLDPENYYLNHFCTEAPEPMNAYSGNVITDERGFATITLPDYFEIINKDFRYQLTVVDDGESDDFVLVKVVRKIRNNQFTIRTSAPRVEVSWRVEGTRNDRWMQKYGYQTIQEKEEEIKGKYLCPELFGMPKEYGTLYRPDIEMVTGIRTTSSRTNEQAGQKKTMK